MSRTRVIETLEDGVLLLTLNRPERKNAFDEIMWRETRDALADMGHEMAEWPEWEWRAGAVCAVLAGPEGTRWGGADPRRGAQAIAR